jgi:Fic family protein
MDIMNSAKIIKLLTDLRHFNVHDIIDYDKYNEILISYHSTAIEGSSLNLDEVSILITDGIAAKGKPIIDHLMVRDHHNALKFVLENARKKTAITPVFIKNISAMVMKSTGSLVNTVLGSYDSSKSDFRKSMVRAGSQIFMDHKKVPDAVDKFCDTISTRMASAKDPVDIYRVSFDAHFELVNIHPFADGNGRVARLLMNFILHTHNLPLAVLFKEDKLEYINALQDSRKSEDISIFHEFMFKQLQKHLSNQLALLRQNCSEELPDTGVNDTLNLTPKQ